jgi:hypothetical protein
MPADTKPIERLLFEGLGNRFTQDSPILPEVWFLFYAQPKKRHALLLTPLAGTRFPKENLVNLRRRLHEGMAAVGKQSAWLDESLLVDASWNDLISLLLPSTPWFQEFRRRFSPLMVEGPATMQRDHQYASLSEKQRVWFWLLCVVSAVEERLEGDSSIRDKTVEQAYETVSVRRRILARGEALLSRTESDAPAIFSISRNRPAERALTRSRATIKADAADRVFSVSCAGVTWAVMDSGIDARHAGFRLRDHNGQKLPGRPAGNNDGENARQSRVVASYDFSLFARFFQAVAQDNFRPLPAHLRPVARDGARVSALRRALAAGSDIPWGDFAPFLAIPHDAGYVPPSDSHGTHVAGILGADVDAGELADADLEAPLQGICPDIRLIDLRVFGPDGTGDEFSILAALQFVRYLNRSSDRQRIHGINLSLSVRHEVANYACGSTPICRECDRLVGSGVVVVAAAGNLGYSADRERWTGNSYRPISITDPGNAEAVITVGATHRDAPHTYGVSYFSSRGPTGDGRAKPDLVAPGEKILSLKPGDGVKVDDGTSMAAPHVSGAAAMLLGRYPELAGQPQRIKSILCSTALDLRRERSFQGAGLVDALKALQSV